MTSTDPFNRLRRVGLISNPHSRRNRSQLAAVEAIVANHADIHHRTTASASEIAPCLAEFAALGVNLLAINGGDGTTARVLTELLEKRAFDPLPTIVLLPGGTTNMNVGDVGLRGALVKTVRRLSAWVTSPDRPIEINRRAVLKVEGASDGKTVYGMFFGTGTIISGIEYCQEKIHTLGIRDEFAPGLVMLRTMWGIARRESYFSAPTATGITLDRQRLDGERAVIQLLITSLQRLFLGLRPYWGQEAGELHCTWIEKPTRKVLRAFPALVRGKPNRHVTADNGYHSHNAERITLSMDGTFTLDGEMHPVSRAHGPLTVSNGATLEFLRIHDR